MKNHDPMSNKTKGPIPLPEGEIPAGTRCVSICIPDSNEAYRTLVGALYELTHWNNWDRDGEHKGTLWAQAWRNALMQGMLQCNKMRITDGVLELSSDGGTVWTPVPQTAPGESGHSPQEIEPIKPFRTDTNARCLAAANATACLVELHREICKWWDDAAVVLVFCGIISAALALFFPVAWTTFALTVNYMTIINAILQHTDALTPESFTTSIQDELTCVLYANADEHGQWTQGALDAIMSDIELNTGSMWRLIEIYLNQIGGYRALCNAGTTTSVASHDCEGCGNIWRKDIDFRVTTDVSEATNWQAHPEFGTCGVWVDGQGWQGNYDAGSNNTFAFILIPFTGHIQHLRMHAYSSYQQSGTDSMFGFYNRDGVTDTQINGNFTVNLGENTIYWDGDADIVDGLVLHARVFGSRTVYIRDISMVGTGTDPFA